MSQEINEKVLSSVAGSSSQPCYKLLIESDGFQAHIIDTNGSQEATVITDQPDDLGNTQNTVNKKHLPKKSKISKRKSKTEVQHSIKIKKLDSYSPTSGSRKNFCSSWYNLPEISPWLDESLLPNHAYCKFCQRDLIAGKSELYKHLNTVKHQRKAAEHGFSSNVNHNSDDEDCALDESIVVKHESVNQASVQCKKVSVYAADDMHVSQTKEVLEAGLNAIAGSNMATSNLLAQSDVVSQLENTAAGLLGKEAALLVLTGTMANTLSVMAHCPNHGSCVLVGDRSYLYRQCQSALIRLNQTSMTVLRNEVDGSINLNDVRTLMADRDEAGYSDYDYHLFRPQLLCIETPHSFYGGQCLSEPYLQSLSRLCEDLRLTIHMDGARLLHAAYCMDISPASLSQFSQSVCVCLNKGLNVHNGSIIAGSKAFIDRCRELSGVFGVSSVRMEGLAATGLIALENYVHHVAKANVHAKNILKGLSRVSTISIERSVACHTNAVLLKCDGVKFTPSTLVQRLMLVTAQEVDEVKERVTVIAKPWSHNTVRLMTHSGLSATDINSLLKKIKYIFDK